MVTPTPFDLILGQTNSGHQQRRCSLYLATVIVR